MVAALDRARTGHHGERTVADRGVQHAHDRVLRMELPRGELEGPADPSHRLDTRQCREAIDETLAARSDLADHGNDYSLPPLMVERCHPLGQDVALDAVDVGFAGTPGHHHEHRVCPSVRLNELSIRSKKKAEAVTSAPSRQDPRS